MQMSVKRKVDEISLKPTEFLLPIFEIIINSIDSIEDSRNSNGKIEIIVNRNKSQTKLFDEGNNIFPIKSFTIKDNGVGFNDKNFESFKTAYTDHKMTKGGKGIGRFTVLAAFKKMVIESVFQKGKEIYERKFQFDTIKEVTPEDGSSKKSRNDREVITSVYIENYAEKFFEKIKVSTEFIGEKIVDHCLLFYVLRNAPLMILRDDLEGKEINLETVFKDHASIDGKAVPFKIAGNSFKIDFIKRYNIRGSHKLHYCAHKREVDYILLKDICSSFDSPLEDENGKYFLSLYLTSKLFDTKVNNLRNSIDLPKNQEEKGLLNELSFEDINQKVSLILEEKYNSHIFEIEQGKLNRIHSYILNPKRPRIEYRHLLNRQEIFKKIPSNVSDDKLEEMLHKISFDEEKERSKKFEKLLSNTKVEDFQEYFSSLKEILEREQEFNKDKLADYIIRRKAIIKVLDRFLDWDANREYKLEEDLHNIIFPMRTTTESIPYGSHNLWLLDERLTFHSFVASDKQIRTNPIVKSNSQKEPDIMIFDFPWAFSDNPDKVNSVIIFEFKRPGRTFSGDERNIDQQVKEYFEILEKSEAKNYKGRLLNVEKNTPKFGFIVCDMPHDLKDYLMEREGYNVTSSKTLYRFFDKVNLYIEIMSYRQLLDSAEQRHQAFFKSLGVDLI